jgi:hypothetical protein
MFFLGASERTPNNKCIIKFKRGSSFSIRTSMVENTFANRLEIYYQNVFISPIKN